MVTIETLTGHDALKHIPDFIRLGDLCLSGWPFFSKRKTDEEVERVVTWIGGKTNSLHMVAVKDGDKLIGGTYGYSMASLTDKIADRLKTRWPLERIYWIAKTVLLPEYQGQKLSHAIYNTRDPWIIKTGGYDAIAHMIVHRDDVPPGHVPYDDIWNKRGYYYLEGLDVKLTYEDGTDVPGRPTEKTIKLWARDLKNG